MNELDQILTVEAEWFAADPEHYERRAAEARLERAGVEPDALTLLPQPTVSTRLAVEIAVALEQEYAETLRIVRQLHRMDPTGFAPCIAGCSVWPCRTYRVASGDEDLVAEIRDEVVDLTSYMRGGTDGQV